MAAPRRYQSTNVSPVSQKRKILKKHESTNSTGYKSNLREAFRINGKRVSSLIENNLKHALHSNGNDLVTLNNVQYYINECFQGERPDFPSQKDQIADIGHVKHYDSSPFNTFIGSLPTRVPSFTSAIKSMQLNRQDSEQLKIALDNKIKHELYYQDIFRPGFKVETLHPSLRGCTREEKAKILAYLVDLLYQNGKLKHEIEPLSFKTYKKNNSQPFQFSDEFQVMENTSIRERLLKKHLERKGIEISESTKAQKRVTKLFVDGTGSQKNMDVIQQNILKSQIKHQARK